MLYQFRHYHLAVRLVPAGRERPLVVRREGEEMDGDASRRAIVRETLTGIANGVIFAIGVAAIAGFWFQSVALALTIGIAMFATFVWAGFSGVIVPLGLRKMGADPAVASSVFVLTLTDVMAFFSFLGLATLILL